MQNILATKIDRQKVLNMSTEEWLEWVKPFKKIIPPYPILVRENGFHYNTVSNVMRGVSENKEVKECIINSIEVALSELQQAALS